jgi:hypothetical protein
MKIDFLRTGIAIAINLLFVYGLYNFHDGEMKILLCGGSFLLLSTTLISAIGINCKQPRATTNIRVVSGIFFTIALMCNIIFMCVNFSVPSYVIINGMLLLLFVLIIYSIDKALK